MILERLAVSGFRALAAPFTFVPNDRFTVIHAPNGTGKTTLLDALYFGLLERHTVTGEKARERFESAGRQLVPRIEVDFAVGDARYRLSKSFLGTKSSSLLRWEAGRYTPLKDGAPADDFIRELLYAEPSGRGAIEPTKHLGLAHVLWSPARASFDRLPDVAGDQIRAMLGTEVSAVTDGERAVQDRVTAEFGKYFTDGGRYATSVTSANIPALEQRIAEAQTELMQARDQYHHLERLTRDYDDRKNDAERMFTKRNDFRLELTKARGDAAVYRELALDTERARNAEQQARELYERTCGAVAQITALRKNEEEHRASQSRAQSEIATLVAGLSAVNERLAAAQKIAEDTGAKAKAIQKQAETVSLAESYVRSRADVESLTAVITAHEAGSRELSDCRISLAETAAPNREELEHLRRQATELARLEATIAAAALAIDIDADTDRTIEVVTAESTGPLTLAAGSSATIAAFDDLIVIDVPGLGRIRARGADGASAVKARKKAKPIEDELAQAWQKYGTASLNELAARTERSVDLRRQIDELERAISDRLTDRTIEELHEARASADARISAVELTHDDWRNEMPDVLALRAEFDHALTESAELASIASSRYLAELQAKAILDEEIARTRNRLEIAAMALEANAVALVRLETDGLDDAGRAERLKQLALDLHTSQGRKSEVDARLASFSENPAELADRLENQEREAGIAYEEAAKQATTVATLLEMQANRGTYQKVNECDERLALLQSELARAKSHAEAIARLREAFEYVRQARVNAVVQPITIAATTFMNRIAGLAVGEIKIGEGFAPTGLLDGISQKVIGIESTLSSGEKEQIYLATRLALADVIASQMGRQLFVVDDALTATDPNRLRRFIAILEELSRERLQVIVTTADQSRYLGIAGAKHVDLSAELLRESAA